MSPHRTRRALLATLAGLGLAGCAADEGTDTPTDRSAGDDSTPADTPSRTEPSPTRSPTDPSTGSPTDTTTASPTAVAREPATPEAVSSSWPIPGADQGQTNYATGAAGPTEPIGELWSVEAGDEFSAPVVADETVFVGGSQGAVHAFDARTGERRWEQSVGITAGRPSVRDGRVYVEGDEAVVALDAADGTELWRVETGDVVGFLAASHGLYVSERADDALVRRSLADGSERWRTSVDGSAPVGRLIASDESVFFRHPRGSGPWSVAVADGETTLPGDETDAPDAERQPTPLPHDSPLPLCYRDGRLYGTVNIFGQVVAFETPVPPFETAWDDRFPPEGSGFKPTVGPDSLYVVTGDGDGPVLRALSASDGSERWTHSLDARAGWPVVAAETVLVRTEETLFCLDPTDGSELWTRSADGIGTTPVVADDLLFTSADGRLRAFRSVEE
ncbi:outer membrane protein assembly factor BamB family protein [Halosimplex sp. J119]